MVMGSWFAEAWAAEQEEEEEILQGPVAPASPAGGFLGNAFAAPPTIQQAPPPPTIEQVMQQAGLGGGLLPSPGDIAAFAGNLPATSLIPGAGLFGLGAGLLADQTGAAVPTTSQALETGYDLYNTDIPYYSDFARENLVPFAGEVGSAAGAFLDPLGVGSAVSGIFGGPSVPEAGRFTGEAVTPVTAGDVVLNAALAGGPVEMVTGIPVDDLLRLGRSGIDNIYRAAMPEPQLFPGFSAGVPPSNMWDESVLGPLPSGPDLGQGPAMLGGEGAPIQGRVDLGGPRLVEPDDPYDTGALFGYNPAQPDYTLFPPRAVPEPPVTPPTGEPAFGPGSRGGMPGDTAFDDAVRRAQEVPLEEQLRQSLAGGGTLTPYEPSPTDPAEMYKWARDQGYNEEAIDAGLRDRGFSQDAIDAARRGTSPDERIRSYGPAGGGTPPGSSALPAQPEAVAGPATPPPASPIAGALPERTATRYAGETIAGPSFTMRDATADEIIASVSRQMGREVSPEEMTWIGNRVNLAQAEPKNITPVRGETPDFAPELRIGEVDPGTYRTGVLDWLNLPRTLMAGADLSYPLRQGVLMIRHAKEFGSAFADMIRAVGSQEYAEQIYRQIDNSPHAALKRNLEITPLQGGTLTAREEQFVSRLTDKLPVYRQMQRGTNVFINKLRSDVADTFIDAELRWVNEGKMTMAQAQGEIDRYMNYLNRATGRGTLGDLDKTLMPLNQVFFSMRYALSKPQAAAYLLDRPFSHVWNEVIKDWAAFLGIGATTLYLADKAGAQVNLDPRSSDFGKIKVGDTYRDIWAGLTPLVRSIYQAASGEKVTSDGKVRDVAAEKVAIDFLRNKLSPQAGAVADLLAPLGYRDAPGANLSTLWRFAAPLFIQDAAEAIKHDGLTGGLLAIPTFFGVGGQSYSSTFGAAAQRKEELNATLSNDANLAGLPPEVAAAIRNGEWNDLTSKEQKAILANLSDEQRAKVEGYEKQLREQKDVFQLSRDERTQREQVAADLKATYGPAFDRLYEEWLKGERDPNRIAQLISDTNKKVNAEANMTRNMGPKLSESKAYQDALKGMEGEPKENLVYQYADAYFGIYDKYKTADGKPDYDRIEQVQQAFLERIRQSDPQLASRVEFYITRDASQDHPVVQLLNSLNDKLSVYYDQPEGTRTDYRRTHAEIDAIYALRNGGPVYSQQAADMLKKWAPEREVVVRR